MSGQKPRLSRADKVSYLPCLLVYGTLFAAHYAGASWLAAGLLALIVWVQAGVHLTGNLTDR